MQFNRNISVFSAQSVLGTLVRRAFRRLFPLYPQVTLIRTEDLLVLRFVFVNFQVQAAEPGSDEPAYLVPGKNAHVVVWFQPQHIAEQAFFETESGWEPKPPDPDTGLPTDNPAGKTAQALLSGPSRLVFDVPDGETPFSYEVPTLLQKIGEYPLRVAPTAMPRPPQFWLPDIYADLNVKAYSQLFALQAATINQKAGLVSLSDQPAERAVYTAALEGAFRSEQIAQPSLITKARLQAYQNTSRAAAYQAQQLAAIDKVDFGKLIDYWLKHPPLRAPSYLETAIEAPYRLIVSPSKYGGWVHASQAVKSADDVYELWHTRLGVRSGNQVREDLPYQRIIRAIWSPDVEKDDFADGPAPANDPFRMTLDASDRHNLVHLTANYTETAIHPRPVDVHRLMLTSLGSWLNLHGQWQPPMGLAVEEWRHIATLARDHYVRVVYKGYLLPFGHRASLIKITERKFHPDPQHPGNTAYLRQRYFIIVRQPERLFNPGSLKTPGGDYYALLMPFTWVRIDTLVTPNLNDPNATALGGHSRDLFWPYVGNGPFMFNLTAEDRDGRLVKFKAPLLFASTNNSVAGNADDMQTAQNSLTSLSGPDGQPVNKYDLGGQLLAYASSQTSGDTAYETDKLTFTIEIPPKDAQIPDLHYQKLKNALNDQDIVRAYPRLVNADVKLPAVRHIAGSQQSTKIEYFGTYLQQGFDAATNTGEVFAQLVNAVNLNFDGIGDKAGGMLQPNLNINGLSRLMGPLSGPLSSDVGSNLADLASGGFDPEKFFELAGAKLFGVLNLWDIVAGLVGGETIANALDRVPRLLTESLTAVEALLKDINALEQLVNEASGELGALATQLQNDISQIQSEVSAIISDPLNGAPLFNTVLDTFSGHLGDLKNALPGLQDSLPVDTFRRLQALADGYLQDLQNAAAYVDSFRKALHIPKELRFRYEWKPRLKDWEKIFLANRKGTPAALVLLAEFFAATNLKTAPGFLIRCTLTDFTLDLIGKFESFVRIYFKKIEFSASSSKKPDVDVVLDEIKFVGVLSFVEVLRDLIPLDGFSDPPALEVDAEGIRSSFSVALPNIAFGVFSLQNLSLGAGFSIPFIGRAMSVNFNFCERHSPFLLTVSMFGGGGFFALAVDPSGVQKLEAAFEFGASLSVNFGVASGGVHVMAGIYYAIERDPSGDEKASLTGYFRLGGSVSVLGLITASIELYLELRYEFSTGKCVGKATLTIEVEVLFFSASVTLTCERKFAGSNGDPTFEELMAPYTDPINGTQVEPWVTYCQAFA